MSRIDDLQLQIIDLKNQIRDLQKEAPGDLSKEYTFEGVSGSVSLTSLFGARQDLIVIHNMGIDCPYCTLWADGFNGFVRHLETRASFVVVTPDPIEIQQQLARDRGWTFRMVRDISTEFTKDMGFLKPYGTATVPSLWPGVSSFYRNERTEIMRVNQMNLGPNDDFCAVWPLLDMLKGGVGDWEPLPPHR